MKIKFFTIGILLSATATCLSAQTNPVRINPNIILPGDSIESKVLIASVNNFLFAAQSANEQNKFVLASQKIETFILLDEINGIGKNKEGKADFYKPYLTNVVPLFDNRYLVQISYIGTIDSMPVLRAGFELIAHKQDSSFLFSSPLLENSKTWKTEKIGNNIFHYQTTINKVKAQAYNDLSMQFDKKLKSLNKATEFYCCDNIIELQKLIGVDYKADYNGTAESIWSSVLDDKQLIVLGNKNAHFDEFDPHDLWHDRLSLVIPRSKVNRPVDEGCAYLYGGSWGLSWEEIFTEFKKQVAVNNSTDWTDIKENPVYFTTGNFNNSADYIVNALLVKKIEKEKGFAGVWELLTIGPVEKGNENYYSVLEKLTGITRANYNEKVRELINNEK